MNLLKKIVARCCVILAGVAAAVLFVLLLAVTFATLSRFFFNKPFAELVDLSSYALVWVAFFGAPWLMLERGHVVIDLLISRVGARSQDLWRALANFAMVLISLVVAYVGGLLTVDYLINGRIMQDVMETPQWILLLPIPVGSFFLALASLVNGIEDLKRARRGSGSGAKEHLKGDSA